MKRRKVRVSKREKHNRLIDSQLHYLSLQWIHAPTAKERDAIIERQQKLKDKYL